jgi:Flp pilus assembly protein TadG
MNRKRFTSRGRSSNRRLAAAAVEAALTMPVLIIITFGAIDVAQYINLAQQVTNASREGARAVSRATTTSAVDVEAAVLDYIADSFPGKSRAALDAGLNVVVRRESNPKSVLTGSLSSVDSGDPVSIDVSFDFTIVRWLPGPKYFDQNLSEKRTFCRRE